MTFTVDIHHHLIPDFYRRATERAGQSVRGVLPAPWSQAGALSFMDDAGIDVAIASISAPRFDAVSAQVCLGLWVSSPHANHIIRQRDDIRECKRYLFIKS